MALRLRTCVLSLAALAVVGCGARKAEVEEPVCEQRDGQLPGGFDLGTLAGEFRLTLVATDGDSAGSETVGLLALVSLDSAFQLHPNAERQDLPFAMVGSAQLSLENVAAVRLGDLGSLEPTSPGVAVLAEGDPSAPGVTLRFGTLANRVGNARFDGGYTALRVSWAEAKGFGGTWASGVMGPEASGYFCAFRPVAGN